MGSELHLILGCMYSGKSSSLLHKLHRYKSIGKHVFFINSIIDNRNFDTHNTQDMKIKVHKTDTLKNVSIPSNINVIGIDEAQFFPDLVWFVENCLKIHGMIIIVAGLDGDYKQEKFGDILSLIPKADKYEKLYAFCTLCKNGTRAPFTKRIINTGTTSPQILVGSNNEYIAVCRHHLNNVIAI